MKRQYPVIRSALKYHGGKGRLIKHIVPVMKYNPIYVEGFVGAGSVMLNIDEPFEKRFCFDIDTNVIDMWKSLRDEGDTIRKWLGSIEYCEEHFNLAKKGIAGPRYAKAVDMIVRSRFSRGGLGDTFAKQNRLRGGIMGDANAWKTFVGGSLPRVIDHIQGVVFDAGCYRELMVRHGLADVKDLTQYLDPTYPAETRTAKIVYEHEMPTYYCESRNDTILCHEGLLKFALNTRGITYLSGYNNPMYDMYLQDCVSWRFEMCNNSGQTKTKSRRVEMLWEVNHGGY